MKGVLHGFIAMAVITTASVSSAKAQVSVSINIGAQPLWGPVGYDVVEYYYLPDIECYYYVPRHQFVYLSGGNWVFSYNLPGRCRGYDLYSGYKVVCNGPRAYSHFSHDRVVYGKYKGWRGRQAVIRDSRDPRYYAVKGHPGRGHGHYKEHGRGHGGHGGGRGHGHGKW